MFVNLDGQDNIAIFNVMNATVDNVEKVIPATERVSVNKGLWEHFATLVRPCSLVMTAPHVRRVRDMVNVRMVDKMMEHAHAIKDTLELNVKSANLEDLDRNVKYVPSNAAATVNAMTELLEMEHVNATDTPQDPRVKPVSLDGLEPHVAFVPMDKDYQVSTGAAIVVYSR